MAVLPIPNYNFKTLDDFLKSLEIPFGYLEKASSANLGDFTESGKIVNAGYNNYTIYWDWYKSIGYGNYQAQPYCAAFVSTWMVAGFGLETAKKLLCGDLFIYCPTGYNNFKNKGRIYSNPKPGDVVFFWSTSLNRWGHTGYVIGVDSDGKGYTTAEANTSSGNNTVVRNGGATCRKHYTLGASKVAFGRPKYEDYGISTVTKENISMKTYAIGTSKKGITCLAETLNVRTEPSTGAVAFQIKKGDIVVPEKKTFVNGAPWFYVRFGKKYGWCSAKYFQGWIQEKDDNGKWWYLKKDYTYPKNVIEDIDGDDYFFGADGYMFVGTISFTTDANGVLKPSTY